MQLNLLLRGQSNAQLLAMSKDWPAVATEVEKLLGFDGVTNTVNLLDKMNSTSNDNTLVGGTAFVGDWVQPAAGGWQQGWTNNTLETGLLNYINELPASEKAAPTAVVWLHNEYDSTNASLTTAEWTSAVRFEAQQVRQALGQSATTVPYVFVNAIPYGSNSIGSVNQSIKQGMAQLAADPGFNAVVGVQSDDLNMDGTFYGTGGTPGVYGGPHMSASDVTLIDSRVALAVAQTFASYALPGSPVALGQVDVYGPEAIGAREVGTNQVLVTASLDHASLSATLDTDAANGVGWSIIDNGHTLAASAAQVTGTNQVRLTFGAAVPTDGTATLYYGYGYGRFATSDSDPGQGSAIYDAQQMPLWAPASGLAIIAACYAAGTRIATADGDVPIERLRVGSRVVAVADGRPTLRPVRWIGQARVDLDRHAHPAQVAPVRIRARRVRGRHAAPRPAALARPCRVPEWCPDPGAAAAQRRDHRAGEADRPRPLLSCRTRRARRAARRGTAGGELSRHRQPQRLRQWRDGAGAASRFQRAGVGRARLRPLAARRRRRCVRMDPAAGARGVTRLSADNRSPPARAGRRDRGARRDCRAGQVDGAAASRHARRAAAVAELRARAYRPQSE